jgi:hypothetical protein
MWRETFRIARRALVANRMRALLALLGIVSGVATVIAMVSLVNGSSGPWSRASSRSATTPSTSVHSGRVLSTVSFRTAFAAAMRSRSTTLRRSAIAPRLWSRFGRQADARHPSRAHLGGTYLPKVRAEEGLLRRGMTSRWAGSSP